jgi:hypothetical protein
MHCSVAQKHGRIHMHTTAEAHITQNTHEDNKSPLPQSIRQKAERGKKTKLPLSWKNLYKSLIHHAFRNTLFHIQKRPDIENQPKKPHWKFN